MKRKIAAIIEVDDDIAYEKIDDGPVPYLESEFGWLAPSGISLMDCFIADDDEDDKWKAYLNYLVEWVFNHYSDEFIGITPACYSEFCKSPSDTMCDKTDSVVSGIGVAEAPDSRRWRVVDRPAKVGDYIRLKEKFFSFNEVGDILMVDVPGVPGVLGAVSVYGLNHPRPTGADGMAWTYFPVSYEVVEPIGNDSDTIGENICKGCIYDLTDRVETDVEKFNTILDHCCSCRRAKTENQNYFPDLYKDKGS